MLSLILAATVLTAPAAPEAADKPVVAAYYYKVRWGFQQEFEKLFFANHYPLLKAQKASGRIKDVEVFKPTYHGDGHADWTFLVVITFSSEAAFRAPGEEQKLIEKLYPDQEKYKKEEQRRFEVLDAHWDVPLDPISPPQ